MLRCLFALIGLLTAANVVAQSFNFEQLIRQGANEIIRATTQPPPAQPSYHPPYQPPPKKAPSQNKSEAKNKSQSKTATKTKMPAAATATSVGGQMAQSGPFTAGNIISSPLLRPNNMMMYKGLPILGIPNKVLSEGARTALSEGSLNYWFSLMELATIPESLESATVARQFAAMALPGESLDKYFICHNGMSCTKALAQFPPKAVSDMAIQGWRAKNEFELPRIHQNFLQDYRDTFIGEAAALPREFYLARPVMLTKYSAEQGGMPMEGDAIPKEKRQRSGYAEPEVEKAYQIVRSVPLGASSASSDFRIPTFIPCSIEECEKLLALTERRRVIVLLKLRLVHVEKKTVPGDRPGTYQPATRVELAGPIEFHATNALEAPIYSYAGAPVLPAPALTSEATSTFKASSVPLDLDTLYLLSLKHRIGGPTLTSTDMLVRSRKAVEKAMYVRAVDEGRWPSDEPWGPFFPAAATSLAETPPADMQAFDVWTKQRADALPAVLTLRFMHKVQNMGPGVNYMQALASAYLAETRYDYGNQEQLRISQNGDIQKRVYEQNLGDPRHVLIAESNAIKTDTKVSKIFVFTFPDAVARYAVPKAFDRLPSGTNHASYSELDAKITSVSFKTSGDTEYMVIDLAPKAGRLYDGSNLVAEAPVVLLPEPGPRALKQKAARQPIPPSPPPVPTAPLAPPVAKVFPFEHDIVGVRLGMAMEEADKIVRDHLKPDYVYSLRAEDVRKGYTDGRLFVSEKDYEIFTLFSAPDGKVVGVDRRLTLPAQSSKDAIQQQVIDKYGQPQDQKTFEWWKEKPGQECRNGFVQGATLALLEGTEPDRKSNAQKWQYLHFSIQDPGSISYSPIYGAGKANHPRDHSHCPPILQIRIDTSSQPNGEGRMRFMMFDHGAYARAQNEMAPPAAREVKVKM